MMTDPIADMLTRMRNAIAARHERVQMPASKIKCEIARLLKEEGYIHNFCVQTSEHPHGILDIELKYDITEASVIHSLQRVSRPGKRHYACGSGLGERYDVTNRADANSDSYRC
jgi:small subunit ribosomal protein S8